MTTRPSAVPFDRAFSQLSSELAAIAVKIENRITAVKSLSGGLPHRNDLDSSLIDEFSQAKSELEAAMKATQVLLKSLAQEVSRKENHPFSALALTDIPTGQTASTSGIASIVEQHNSLAAAGGERRLAAAAKVELSTIGEIKMKAIELATEAQMFADEQEQLRAEKRGLSDEFAELSTEDLDPQPLADALNRDLKVLLGRDELAFVVVADGYQITRGGVPARGLSEGEQNAISLLYFLRSLEEHNVTLADSVVVIDDPVSSLDSSNLLAASSFIWSRLVGKSAQLFLFTHSFELFRTWSQLLKGAKITLDKQGKSGLLFELRAKYEMVDGEPRRLVKLRNWPKHPEATRLRSEYQYLFSQVLDGLSDLQNDPSEAQLMNAAALLPNATRRVLEGFLAFKRPQEIGDLRGQLKGAKPPDLDDELWQRVLRFADDYSHMEHADTDRHLERPEVLGHLQAVLAFIGDVDPTHVSDMCQALDRPKPNLSIS